MNSTDVFLDKYKQVEAAVRMVYSYDGESPLAFLKDLPQFKRFSRTIDTCRGIRNILQHSPKINGEYPLTPCNDLLPFLDRLIQCISERKRCSDIAIRYKDIFWCSLDDSVKDAMRQMRNCMFTHAPILDEDKRVIGVFDENSIFEYIADEGIVDIDDNIRFRTIQKHLSLTEREMEEFLFVAPGKYVEDLEEQIEEKFHNNKRVGIVFLTADGKQTSSLYGIITPWDIIAAAERN